MLLKFKQTCIYAWESDVKWNEWLMTIANYHRTNRFGVVFEQVNGDLCEFTRQLFYSILTNLLTFLKWCIFEAC